MKIKSITTFRTDFGTFQNTEEDYYKSGETFYDEEGNVKEEIEYNAAGRYNIITKYAYRDGKLVAKAINYIQDETVEKYLYGYDDKGNQIQEDVYYNDELFERQVKRFNDNGDVYLSGKIDEEGTELEKDAFEYNAEHKLISHEHYEGEEEPIWTLYLEYDDKGLNTGEKKVNADKSVEKTTYVYNEAGLKTRSDIRDAKNNLVAQITVEYDERNNPVRYTSETFGINQSKMINQVTYDEENKMLDNEYYDVKNGYMVIRESYTYNENGEVLTEEIFEVNPVQQAQKTHYKLQKSYEYFLENEK